MPLEVILPDSRPDAFNTDWPETVDPIYEGAAHIRGLKVVTNNMGTDWLTFKNELGVYFPGGLAIRATASDTLEGEPLSFYLDPENLNGEITTDQAPEGNLVGPGLVLLSNDISETNETHAATAKALKSLEEFIANKDVSSDLVLWTDVALTSSTEVVLPTELMAELTAGNDVEVCFTVKIAETPAVLVNEKTYIWSEDFTTPKTYYNIYTEFATAQWTIVLSTVAGDSKFIIPGGLTPAVTVLKFQWRKTLSI